jgi:hypothetical protein
MTKKQKINKDMIALATGPIAPAKMETKAEIEFAELTFAAPGGATPVWPLQTQCGVFYGNPYSRSWQAANLVHVHCPWPLLMGRYTMYAITIHRKCAESLTRVLATIWDAVDHDLQKIHALHYDTFDGSFNLRNKRGGSSLSMHAYAAAIDFDAEDNEFHHVHHFFSEDSLIVKAFEAEGWVWGGRWQSSIDAMHFQAARIHP